jgi:hypothetical protein
MLSLKPRAPGHQRPCRQSAKGVSELLGDMDAAMKGNEDRKDDRYSSGTVILHENAADDCLDVVNGRQRLLTPVLITLWLYELASFPLMTPRVQGRALRSACGCASAREGVIYRDLPRQDKRLAQATDYLCSVELAAMRYALGGESSTYRRFWGGKPRSFKQNRLKQARGKALR